MNHCVSAVAWHGSRLPTHVVRHTCRFWFGLPLLHHLFPRQPNKPLREKNVFKLLNVVTHASLYLDDVRGLYKTCNTLSPSQVFITRRRWHYSFQVRVSRVHCGQQLRMYVQDIPSQIQGIMESMYMSSPFYYRFLTFRLDVIFRKIISVDTISEINLFTTIDCIE